MLLQGDLLMVVGIALFSAAQWAQVNGCTMHVSGPVVCSEFVHGNEGMVENTWNSVWLHACLSGHIPVDWSHAKGAGTCLSMIIYAMVTR